MIRQVYVAGAYTADTRTRTLQHISRALVAGCDLAKAGLHPIVPHTMGSHRATWEQAMTRCRETIQGLDPACDCLALLPGWEGSRGAVEERALAESLGLPVMTVSEALVASGGR